jgi:flagellar motor protein MotB
MKSSNSQQINFLVKERSSNGIAKASFTAATLIAVIGLVHFSDSFSHSVKTCVGVVVATLPQVSTPKVHGEALLKTLAAQAPLVSAALVQTASVTVASAPIAGVESTITQKFVQDFKAKKVIGVLELSEIPGSAEVTVILDSDKFFESGTATLSQRATEPLREIESLMKNMNANARVEIEGHTDTSPVVRQKKFFPSNWELSSARAASLVPMLEQAGFKKDQLKVIGFGDSRPVASIREPASAKNRRIIFRIFPEGDEQKSL